MKPRLFLCRQPGEESEAGGRRPGRWTAGSYSHHPWKERNMIWTKPPGNYVPAVNLQGCTYSRRCIYQLIILAGYLEIGMTRIKVAVVFHFREQKKGEGIFVRGIFHAARVGEVKWGEYIHLGGGLTDILEIFTLALGKMNPFWRWHIFQAGGSTDPTSFTILRSHHLVYSPGNLRDVLLGDIDVFHLECCRGKTECSWFLIGYLVFVILRFYFC